MTMNTNGRFAAAAVMPWLRLEPPVLWPAYGLYVIADRHLPDGTRQHIVKESVPAGEFVGKAQVFGEDDLPLATLPMV